MYISVFDIFKIGIGPSSSHTVGPMKATRIFLEELKRKGDFAETFRIAVELYGSLALTGRGHGTDKAVIAGLFGEEPHRVDPDKIEDYWKKVFTEKEILLAGTKKIPFVLERDLVFRMAERLPQHANALKITAFSQENTLLQSQVYFSVGGGFIVSEEEFGQVAPITKLPPFVFTSADELLNLCRTHHFSIGQLMMANEQFFRSGPEIETGLLDITAVMAACIQKGCQSEGILPGGLNVQRRAANIYKKLLLMGKPNRNHPDVMNWINVYAMAVNEENAAGGRVVTAPTNGAAGIVPAVLQYFKNFCEGVSDAKIVEFLLTAGAIAILYKLNASISGAEVGCQGEVGVACSMAAGALTAVLGGTLEQVENAAEIGMEHNLGLPCDPPRGLVQIPCIERNAMGAVKAINAAHLALAENGQHKVSLDAVIKTMNALGKDMKHIYKETSLGGLAVNFPEC